MASRTSQSGAHRQRRRPPTPGRRRAAPVEQVGHPLAPRDVDAARRAAGQRPGVVEAVVLEPVPSSSSASARSIGAPAGRQGRSRGAAARGRGTARRDRASASRAERRQQRVERLDRRPTVRAAADAGLFSSCARPAARVPRVTSASAGAPSPRSTEPSRRTPRDQVHGQRQPALIRLAQDRRGHPEQPPELDARPVAR